MLYYKRPREWTVFQWLSDGARWLVGAKAAAADMTVTYFRRPRPSQTGCTAVEEEQLRSTTCRHILGTMYMRKQCLCRSRAHWTIGKVAAQYADIHAREQWEVFAARMPRPCDSSGRSSEPTYALQQRQLLAKARQQRHQSPVIKGDQGDDADSVEQRKGGCRDAQLPATKIVPEDAEAGDTDPAVHLAALLHKEAAHLQASKAAGGLDMMQSAKHPKGPLDLEDLAHLLVLSVL